jgi:hypothetical protein
MYVVDEIPLIVKLTNVSGSIARQRFGKDSLRWGISGQRLQLFAFLMQWWLSVVFQMGVR